jgi:hypothetical protein
MKTDWKYGWRRQMAMCVARDAVNLIGALGFTPVVRIDKKHKKLLLDLPELSQFDKNAGELHRLNLEATLKAIQKGGDDD